MSGYEGADKLQPQARRGGPIRLVRWYQDRDGWHSQTVNGKFIGRDARNWRIHVDGEESAYSRHEWNEFTVEKDVVIGAPKPQEARERPAAPTPAAAAAAPVQSEQKGTDVSETTKTIPDEKHGTPSGYSAGCRDEDCAGLKLRGKSCRGAVRDYQRELRERRNGSPSTTPAPDVETPSVEEQVTSPAPEEVVEEAPEVRTPARVKPITISRPFLSSVNPGPRSEPLPVILFVRWRRVEIRVHIPAQFVVQS